MLHGWPIFTVFLQEPLLKSAIGPLDSTSNLIPDHAQPLVTVVVLCHNQAAYVVEALDSVLNQHYVNWQLLVVDDGSDDASQDLITQWVNQHDVADQVVLLPNSMGMTSAFMQVGAYIKGKYILDLAADDILLPDRLLVQVNALERAIAEGKNPGLCFSDALMIDAHGNELGQWFAGRGGQLLQQSGSDWVVNILAHNPVLTPTILYVTEAWRAMGGYDTTLAFEDTDMLLKLTEADYDFVLCPEITTKRRVIPKSASEVHSAEMSVENPFLASTARICEKYAAKYHGRTGTYSNPERAGAWAFFTRHQYRVALLSGQVTLAHRFAKVLKQLRHWKWTDEMMALGLRIRLVRKAVRSLKQRRESFR